MTYEEFLEESLSKGLLRRQKSDLRAVEKSILRAHKDLKTAKANLDIDEGIAYRGLPCDVTCCEGFHFIEGIPTGGWVSI